MVRVAVLFCLLLLGMPVFAAAVPVADVARVSLDDAVQYLEDPEGTLRIEQVRDSATPWQLNGGDAFNQGYNSSVWWLHVQLANDNQEVRTRYLELGYAVLDRVDVFIFSGADLLQQYALGDLQPFAARPVDNRFFVLPLTFQAGQTLDVYYRIDTETSVQAPLSLWQRDAFESDENRSNIAHGFYYGAMVMIAVYNLLIFLVLLDRSHLYYVCFVLSTPLFMASLSGQAYRYLWPESVGWNDNAIPVFLGAAFLFSSLFIRRFLRVREWSRWADNTVILVAIISGSCMVLAFFTPYHFSIRILVALGVIACLFDLAVGFMALSQRIPTAPYYVIAWMSFLLGAVLLALNKMDFLPNNFVTEYAIQIGSMLEAVLLSFAMAERINQERRLRFEAQDEALRTTRRLNEELEARVRERTRELEVLNVRLQDLSNTDQLTGLKNRRYLEQALEQEWIRCARYGHSLAFIMMDVDFFKPINDTHGHAAGDLCLQRVAQQVQNAVRWPTDLVARYGGEEFCMLLPETDAEGARDMAERLREAVAGMRVRYENKTLSVTLSLGICAVVPSDQCSVEHMLKCADLALYQAKENGRNRVVVHSGKQGGADVVPLVRRPPDPAQ